MKKCGLLFTDIVNKLRTYYIIVAHCRIVAELDHLVLEGLQPVGGRYVVYLGMGAEAKKTGLKDVRRSFNHRYL